MDHEMYINRIQQLIQHYEGTSEVTAAKILVEIDVICDEWRQVVLKEEAERKTLNG